MSTVIGWLPGAMASSVLQRIHRRKSDTQLTRIDMGMIYGEAKQTCGSARMDCAGGERTKATFQKQKPRYNDLQGTEAHAWCLKTKGA